MHRVGTQTCFAKGLPGRTKPGATTPVSVPRAVFRWARRLGHRMDGRFEHGGAGGSNARRPVVLRLGAAAGMVLPSVNALHTNRDPYPPLSRP